MVRRETEGGEEDDLLGLHVSSNRWCLANSVSSDAKGLPSVSGALAVDGRWGF